MDNSRQAGRQPANKLAINADTICIYAFFDKCENASGSFGAALVESTMFSVCMYVMTMERTIFCSFVSLCYFTFPTMTTPTTVTMTKNRIIAFGIRKWRRNEEEKSRTHMANTTRATYIYFKKEILFLCVCERAYVVGDTLAWSDVIVIICIAPHIVHKRYSLPTNPHRIVPHRS